MSWLASETVQTKESDGKDHEGNWAAYPREGFETMQSHFHNVQHGDVMSKSPVPLCLHRQSLASSSVRLRLNLPQEQVLGCAFKTRNRTLSHRELFHQASPGCQTRSLFLFSALHSAQSIIQWLPSLFFLSFPVRLGSLQTGGGFVPGTEGAHLSQGHDGCCHANHNFPQKGNSKCLCVLFSCPCAPRPLLWGQDTSPLPPFALICLAFPKPYC